LLLLHREVSRTTPGIEEAVSSELNLVWSGRDPNSSPSSDDEALESLTGYRPGATSVITMVVVLFESTMNELVGLGVR
jgi:hypothetical protein